MAVWLFLVCNSRCLQNWLKDCNVTSTDSYSAHALCQSFPFCFPSLWSYHPSLSSFVLLTFWLMVKKGKNTSNSTSKPSTHANTLIEHAALNSPVWMGPTPHSVARTTAPARGNLPARQKSPRGADLVPTSRCLSWAPKLPCDDTTHTPVKLWFICLSCDVSPLPSTLNTSDTRTQRNPHTGRLARRPHLPSHWTTRWLSALHFITLCTKHRCQYCRAYGSREDWCVPRLIANSLMFDSAALRQHWSSGSIRPRQKTCVLRSRPPLTGGVSELNSNEVHFRI